MNLIECYIKYRKKFIYYPCYFDMDTVIGSKGLKGEIEI